MENYSKVIMKSKLWVILLLVFGIGQVEASVGKGVGDMYLQLDEAIAHSDDYVKVRLQRIAQKRVRKSSCYRDADRLQVAFDLYEEYRSFQNDSAVAYLNEYIVLAQRCKNPQAEGNAKALLAFQNSSTGRYMESYSILSRMDTTALDQQGKRNYLIACLHLYGELGYYSNIQDLRSYYQRKAKEYHDLLLGILAYDDDYYLQLKEVDFRMSHNYAKALEYNDLRLAKLHPGTHDYAIVAYYRALIYQDKGDKQHKEEWLLKAALCDVKLAVMDQGTLWEIANILSQEKDGLHRSYQYIKFAWEAARMFNTTLRSNQIMPVLTSIEESYQEQLTATNRNLKIMISLSVLLIIVVLSLLLYVNKQRKRLALAHQELKNINADLKNANSNLNESNKMKEVYIGRFLRLSALYMDKLEAMRKRVARLLRNREFAKLDATLQANVEDVAELYEYFDSAFLKLFPNFVNDFNQLLRPEERIILPEENKLTTTIRIFALIRLGIEDSSKIAEFLHYSVNTIYNYRAKVKNGALCDRDSFEERVKHIGMK